MSLALTAAAVLTALDALIDWACVWTDRRRVEYVTKPLVMVGLIVITLLAGHGETASWWLVAALFFGMLGDIALIGSDKGRFLAGVAAFFVGHAAYIGCFVVLGLSSRWWSWLAFAAVVGMLVVTRRVVPAAHRLDGWRLAVPIAAYSLTIGVMLVLAWLTAAPLVALGALIFVVSDSMIGLRLADQGLTKPAGGAYELTIMVTYHVGQALIALGVLLAL